MKVFVYALVVALLLAGQLITPVSAAAAGSAAAQSTCGDTYTVKKGDYLSKIAKTCNVPLQTIISLNPQITNINKIYPGQVIRLTSSGNIPVTGGTYVVQPGDTLSKIAKRYGTTVYDILLVNPQITNPSLIYVGQVINLPSGTTSGSSYISLSTTAVKPGGTVQVKVWGFPANANIDYRTGKKDQPYVSVVDGRTSAYGDATATITIPSTAVKGEQWVVKVQTTDLTKGFEVTSPVITIQ